jgi:hypothetical protein
MQCSAAQRSAAQRSVLYPNSARCSSKVIVKKFRSIFNAIAKFGMASAMPWHGYCKAIARTSRVTAKRFIAFSNDCEAFSKRSKSAAKRLQSILVVSKAYRRFKVIKAIASLLQGITKAIANPL